VCASREPCVKAKGILDRVPSCVNRQFVTSIRGLNRESTQQAQGCITVLGTKQYHGRSGQACIGAWKLGVECQTRARP
jgi:hypothetical protein